MKYCKDCNTTKDLSAFGIDRQKRDGLSNYCKPCRTARTMKRYWRNVDASREARRDESRTRRYGIGPADFVKMLNKQGGVCAICERPQEWHGDQALHVDHDHETGQVRGLLCGFCNLGLANFREDPKYLLRAVDYLEQAR